MRQRLLTLFCILLVSSTPLLAQLTAPTGLTATVRTDGTSVTLAWTDANTTETGFRIEYTGPDAATFTNTQAVATVNATSAVVSGLQAGSRYQFRVLATTATAAGPASNTATATMPLLAPTGISATHTGNGVVNLTWTDANTTETGFIIEYTAPNGSTYSATQAVSSTGSALSATISGLTAGVYQFRVKAVNTNFPTGGPVSSSASVSVGVNAPGSLTATLRSDGSSVTLAWTDNSTNETGFRVEYTSPTSAAFTNTLDVPTPNATSAVVTGLQSGTLYSFRVVALSGTLASPVSNTASVTTFMVAPSGLVATQSGDGRVTLTWSDTNPNEQGFLIEYTAAGGSTFVSSQTITSTGTALSADITGLTPGAYQFRVKAYNANNPLPAGGPASTAASATVIGPPTAPTALALSQPTETLSLVATWTDNSADETGYEISYSTDGTTWSAPVTTGAFSAADGKGTYTFTNLTPNRTYQVRTRGFRLVNGVRIYSAYSNTASLLLKDTTPLAPTNLKQAGITSTSITLQWTDNSNNEEKFEIYVNGVLKDSVTANTTTYTVSNLQPNTEYTFIVRAYNNRRTTFSPFSNTLVVRTYKLRPVAVTGLTATKICGTSVNLVWQDTQEEDSYAVERSADNGTTWTELKALPANATTYLDAAAPPNQTLLYRIKATNNGGSSYSTALSVRTLPVFPPNPPVNFALGVFNNVVANISWANGSEDTDCKTNERLANEIWIKADGEGDFRLIATLDKNATAYLIQNLNEKTGYTIKIRSTGPYGASPFTQTIYFVTEGRPYAPSNFRVVPMENYLGNPYMQLNWDDNSADELVFKVDIINDAKVAEFLSYTATNANYFMHLPVEEGVTYFYLISALNKYGQSAYAPINGATIPFTRVPNPPFNLRVKSLVGKPQLLWNDDSIREEGFEVERSEDDGKTFKFIQLVERNKTTYIDNLAQAGRTYQYRVRATNPRGKSEYTLQVPFTVPQGDLPPASAGAVAEPAAINVYPNPAAEFVVIETPQLVSVARVAIVDNNNKKVGEFTLNGAGKQTISLESLPTGLYLLRFEGEGRILHTKRIYKK